ncbi:hypothetical protein Tco_0833743 [Tanacetum coccineum]
MLAREDMLSGNYVSLRIHETRPNGDALEEMHLEGPTNLLTVTDPSYSTSQHDGESNGVITTPDIKKMT